MQKSKANNQLFKIVLTAILIALNVILERFIAFVDNDTMLTLSCVTVGFAAVYLGIQYAIAVAAIGDIIGAMFLGGYFFGFTLTNIIYALIISLALYKNPNIIKIFISVVSTKLICTTILNSMCMSWVKYKNLNFIVVEMIERIPQALFMTVVEIVVLTILFPRKSKIRTTLDKNIKRFL